MLFHCSGGWGFWAGFSRYGPSGLAGFGAVEPRAQARPWPAQPPRQARLAPRGRGGAVHACRKPPRSQLSTVLAGDISTENTPEKGCMCFRLWRVIYLLKSDDADSFQRPRHMPRRRGPFHSRQAPRDLETPRVHHMCGVLNPLEDFEGEIS